MSDDRRRELECQLSAYLDDELGLAERREVEALLAADEDARTLLKELRATAEAVRNLPRARASDHLIESLRARMERQSLLEGRPVPVRTAGRGRSYPGWFAAAAVIGLVAGAGYLAWPWVRDQLDPPGRQYAMRGDERRRESPAEGPPAARVSQVEGDDRAVEPPPPAAVPVARAPALGSPDGGRMIMAAESPDDPAVKPAQDAREISVLAGPTVAGATVLEATFADAASRREAVAWLRDEYAFRPVEAPDSPGDPEMALEVRVPDRESARRVVNSLNQSRAEWKFRVVSWGEDPEASTRPDEPGSTTRAAGLAFAGRPRRPNAEPGLDAFHLHKRAAAQAKSAPAGPSESRLAPPGRLATESSLSRIVRRIETRPAEQEADEPAVSWGLPPSAGSAGSGGPAPAKALSKGRPPSRPGTLRLYVRVAPPATAPAAVDFPASLDE